MHLFKFFQKKPKKIDSRAAANAIEAHYLINQEKQKSARLADHLKAEWSAEEESQCLETLQKIFQEQKPSYTFESFEQVRKDYERGIFISLPDKETIGRLSYYGRMVEKFPSEMGSTTKGEDLFQFFEKARHNRIMAYHLYQLSDSLQAKLSASKNLHFEQLIWESGIKREFLDVVSLHEYLKKLSLELGRIMVQEIHKTIADMEKTMANPEDREALLFEKEVGVEALKNKIESLQMLSDSLTVQSLKAQILSKFH